MNKKAFAGLFLLIVIGAAALRFFDLGLRPMHHDEANQAVKFGALLEKGEYRYDRADHHGPSLYYLSLPFARALGEFGATIIFAGNFPGRTQTMPLAIYVGFEINLSTALLLSFILICFSFLTLAAVKLVLNRSSDRVERGEI